MGAHPSWTNVVAPTTDVHPPLPIRPPKQRKARHCGRAFLGRACESADQALIGFIAWSTAFWKRSLSGSKVCLASFVDISPSLVDCCMAASTLDFM